MGGNISQLVYLTPHPRFWNGDCLHIMKWLWSITILKMMKFSYNPSIFCLFTLISQLKYLRWWVGGNLSQLVYLAPHSDFLSSDWLWILNCCLLLLQLLMGMFHEIQILPATIQKTISWNSSIYWWGATYPSWFTLPPTQDFGEVTVYTYWNDFEVLHYLKWWNLSYNPDIFCLFTLISHLKYLRWWWGATYPSWFILPPTRIFWAVIGYGFWIAVYCFYNY